MNKIVSASTYDRILQKSSQSLNGASRALRKASLRLYQSPQQRRVAPWLVDQGDKTLRVDYDLDEHSLVFDLGGYEGQWASAIFARYCCSIHVFEPVDRFAAQIERRFSRNKKVIVHRYGLASETKTASITLAGDGSSMFGRGRAAEQIQLVRALDFMEQKSINVVDLMKINIEGGEYDLLEHLIGCGFLKRIKNIQVQFHDFVPDAAKRMARIQGSLATTHFLTYQYPFVWENWRWQGAV